MNEIFDRLRTWAEIDLDAVNNNFDAARRVLPENMKLLAVIKANAYGHGAVKLAKELSKKADFFAVATTDEAIELRRAGINNRILLLGHIPYGDFPLVIKYDTTPAVSDINEASELSKTAVALKKHVLIHLVIDTGMSRIGFHLNDDSVKEIKEISSLPNIEIEGMFSHLAAADCLDKTYAEAQISKFDYFSNLLSDAGIEIPIRHLFNSAAIVDFKPKYNMAREGIILYGLHPSNEVKLSEFSALKPAMSLKSHVVQVKRLPKGVAVSYGCTYVTEGDTDIATVSAGYADGVPRLLSNKGFVIINGMKAPIIGRICMDQFMVDVTAMPGVKAGDTVTIFGTDGTETITADEVAESIGTIGYELVCNINRRVPRVYIKNGEVNEITRVLPNE